MNIIQKKIFLTDNMFEIKEVKDLRKKFGLTQTQLAKQAGVSQSLIAKIEAGKIDPTYSNAKKLFDTLLRINNEHELKAKDIMNQKIIFINSRERLKDVIKKMKKHEISQLPVIDEQRVVGLITESSIIEHLVGDELPNPTEQPVEKIMDQSPPIITPNTSLSIVSTLLKHFPLLLVADKGIHKGLITKADLIRKIST
ncbi:CBS domain-containing protein [Candidatus Woesearchaeota archaeon]|nr:CBS domain-containing protein [Candidatus Woesearchaeota archaeon]